MSYIRWGEGLRDGRRSTSYVLGGPENIINMSGGAGILYSDLMRLFKEYNEQTCKRIIGRRLYLRGEELEVVCERLFQERENGEWN